MTVADAGVQTPQNKGDLSAWIDAGKPYRFKPGQSGNPGGRPKKIREAEKTFEEALVKAAEKVIASIDDENAALALKASLEVIERVMGKATQKIETKDTSDARELDEQDLIEIAHQRIGSEGTA